MRNEDIRVNTVLIEILRATCATRKAFESADIRMVWIKLIADSKTEKKVEYYIKVINQLRKMRESHVRQHTFFPEYFCFRV